MGNSRKRELAAAKQALRRSLLNKLEERGIRRTSQGLVVTVRSGQEMVAVAPFKVLGGAEVSDGILDGVAIAAPAADGKSLLTGHVPYLALQEPKRMAPHLAAIGLSPPIETALLKPIAQYMHTLGQVERCRVFGTEGMHRIEGKEGTYYVAAVGGSVIAPSAHPTLGIPPVKTIYVSGGTLSGWKEAVRIYLDDNPLILFSLLIAFGAACAYPLGIPSLSALLVGDSSLGKSTLARLMQAANYSPEKLKLWSATNNGAEVDASEHCDAAMVLDELGAKDQGSLSSLIYRLSGGSTKSAATATGEARVTKPMRCAILATGELTKEEQGRSSREVMRNGVEARLITIPVTKSNPVFRRVPKGMSGAGEAADRLYQALKKHYGHAGPEFVRLVIENQASLIRRAPEKIAKYKEKVIKRTACGALSPLEGRVLTGFLTLALAGKIAVHFGLLPTSGKQVMNAVCHVFKVWLEQWRADTRSKGSTELIQAVRAWFQQHAMSLLVPLPEWDVSGRRSHAGYVHEHPKKGTLYLVRQDAMRDVVCKGLRLSAVLDALDEQGLLVTEGRGRMFLQRMPGMPKKGKNSRIRFYAVRGVILFDE